MKTLSLQGGGCRGYMQCVILDAQGNPPFDLIAGTSVGSIVGGCYALGLPAARIIGFFTDLAPKIFSGGAYWLPRAFSSAKYSPDNLRSALQSVVGDATLADCTRFIATAVCMDTGRTIYFQSYGESSSDGTEIIVGPDSGVKLVDVMMASSAAQTYFPAHRVGELTCWDGGNSGFNAPDMLLLTEAEKLVPLAEIEMLSLGNGQTPWPYKGAKMVNPGIATALEATLDIAYGGPEAAMVWLAAHRLGTRHKRINPVIPNFDIDDARPATLEVMRTAALKAVHA